MTTKDRFFWGTVAITTITLVACLTIIVTQSKRMQSAGNGSETAKAAVTRTVAPSVAPNDQMDEVVIKAQRDDKEAGKK